MSSTAFAMCSVCDGTLRQGICDRCRIEHVVICPHPGPQSKFLASKAKIKIYGGAAGGGKTWALLIDALGRALSTPGWAGLICRSLLARMTDGGGAIWAEAHRVFDGTGAAFNESRHEVRWPNGSTLAFRQIVNNRDMWNGPSFDWIGIEELQEVEIEDLLGALTRLRSTRVAPALAATCNPKRGHGLVQWIEWYLLPSGEADPERSGTVRWYCRHAKTDEFIFGDTAAEAESLAGAEDGDAISFAFFRALLEDNPALDDADPSYRANLRTQGRVKRAQLERGNWYAGGEDDGPLARDRWEFVTAPIAPIIKWVRAWDKAATRPWSGNMDPDYTAGPLVGFDAAGRVYLSGLAACREDPPLRDVVISTTAALDGHMVSQIHKVAPGDAGKDAARHTGQLLGAAGGHVSEVSERAAKHGVERIGWLALQLELGMYQGRPVSPAHPLPEGVDAEPRFFVLDGPAQPSWPASYRPGWLLERYSDAGSHPRTLGELAWSQLDPWPRGGHDDIPDALADAVKRGAARPAPDRARAARDRAASYIR